MTSEKQRPVNRCTSGPVTAAIFENENTSRAGETFKTLSVVFTRSYTDDDGKTFKHTDSMKPQHLADVIAAARMAQAWIESQPTDKRAAA